jgi:hypothetical protein
VVIEVGSDAVATDVGAPATTVTFPLEQMVTLFCGRSDADRDGVEVDGDPEVGRAVVDALTGLTP